MMRVNLRGREKRAVHHFVEMATSLILGVGLLLCGGCVSTLERLTFGISVKIGEPFEIITTDQAAGWGSASHPFLCPLSTNRIMITY